MPSGVNYTTSIHTNYKNVVCLVSTTNEGSMQMESIRGHMDTAGSRIMKFGMQETSAIHKLLPQSTLGVVS